MGKADKKAVNQGISKGQQTSDTQYGAGITGAQERLYGPTDAFGNRSGGAIQQGQQERSNLLGGYGNLASSGGLQEGEYGNLMNGGYGRGYDRSYLDTYRDLSGPSGGFDSSRLANIGQSSNYLRGLSGAGGTDAYGDVNQGISGLLKGGNWNDVNSAISGLQDIGRTGGVGSEDISRINRPLFEEYERTGGYSPEDIANIRSRTNQGTTAVYSNLRDAMDRNRLAGGYGGPGLGATNFKLARQSAQAAGENARDTELGISNAVREGRMGAANTIAQNQLALSRLTSGNKLQAYGTAGGLGMDRERASQDAMARAASLGLSRQEQINAAQQAAAGIDLQTQGLMNQSRIAGASGLQSSEERQRQLDAENQRYLISQRTGGQLAGLGGLANTYGSMSGPESFYQNLLRDYTGGETGANLGWNSQRIQAGSMPGIGSSIANIAGGIGGMFGGIGGLFNRNQNQYGNVMDPWYGAYPRT